MTPSTRFLAFVLWAVSAAALSAGTPIYEDDFSGTGDLNATAPDTSPGSETWTASTNWDRNSTPDQATNTADANANAFLPFTPDTGKIYTLSMDIDISNSTDNWVAMGFSSNSSTGTAFYALNDSYSWALLRGNVARSGSEIGTFGKNLANRVDIPTGTAEASPANTFDTLKIELDTTGTFWKTTWYISEGAGSTFKELRNFTYSVNPSISYVGFGIGYQTGKFPDATVRNFSLTAVPELSNVGLVGFLLGAGFLTRRRRRG